MHWKVIAGYVTCLMKSASVALIQKNLEVPSYILTSGELHVAQL